MIISGGENIYSVEVERVIAEHPAVMDIAVIGIPDDRWGEAVMAVVALRPGTQASEQDIVSWSRERLATYKCPKTVYFIEELPRNPTGKIRKRELRKPFWENRERVI
jgi:acyl-CoA synthetase (AMP-forming)/AMP-acid ligase II